MATLTSKKIKNTYDALLKSIDNDAIGTTAKQITDGLGNVTPLYVSTTQVGIGVTPESGLNLHVFGDAKIGSNLTVIGNLVVEGSTTTVGTDTLTVKDPLIVLANNNTSTDAVDIGFYGKYTPSGTTLYSGLFREALTGKYRLFKGLEVEPTTTVNTSGTGYARADLVIGDLEATQVDLGDNDKIRLGDSQDLEIYHNGTSASIRNNTGDILISALEADSNIKFYTDNGTGTTVSNLEISGSTGTVSLKYYGSQKLYTTSTGISVTGRISQLTDPSAAQDAATKNYVDTQIGANNELSEVLANGNTTGGTNISVSAGDDIDFTDTSEARFGSDQDLIIKHTGTTGSITNFVGNLNIVNNANDSDIRFFTDDGVGGITTYFQIDGDVQRNIFYKDTKHSDSVVAYFGNGDDLQIYHTGSHAYLTNDTGNFEITTTGNLILQNASSNKWMMTNQGGGVLLYYNGGTSKLTTTPTGISINGRISGLTDPTLAQDAATKAYVDLQVGNNNELSEVLANGNTTGGTDIVVSTSDQIFLPDGSSTNPSIAFSSNTNTGIYYTTNDVSFTVNGSEKASIGDGQITLQENLIVNDTISADNYINIEGGTNPYLQIQDTTNEEYLNLYSSDNESAIVYSQDTFKISSGVDFLNQTPRLTIDSSGNVGIGTTSPSYRLTAYGSSTNSEIVASFGSPNAQNEYTAIGLSGFIASNGATKTGLALKRTGTYGTGELHFLNNNTLDNSDMTLSDSKMMINSSGNVGIGTTSPDAKLHIDSTGDALKFTRASQETYLFEHGTSGLYTKLGTTLLTGWTQDHDFKIYDNTASQYVMFDGSTQRVGIGTTSPNSTLEVNGDIKLSTAADKIVFGSGGTSPAWSAPQIARIGSFMTMSDYSGVQFGGYDGTSYGPRMTVLGTGNVGIGETSPSYNLVVGDGTTDTESRFYHNDASYTSIRGYGLFMSRENSYIRPVNDGSQTLYIGSANNTWGTFSADANIFTLNRDGVSRLYINSTGNVGIGTTSPERQLSLYSNNTETTPRFLIEQDGTGDAVMAFSLTGGQGWSMGIDNSGGDSFMIHNSSGGVDSSSQFTIKTDGNVGIGTSSPSVQLDIEDSSNVLVDMNTTTANANTTIRLQESGSVKATIGYDGTNDGLILTTGGFTAGNGIFIDDSQNVGIGTTSPTAPLHIEGGTNSEVLKIEADSNPFVRWVENGTNVGFLQFLGDNAYLSNMSNGSFFFRTNNTDKMTILAGGNVGIGTTSPAYKLHSTGTIGIAGNTANNAIRLSIDEATTFPGSNTSVTRLLNFVGDNGGENTEIGGVRWLNTDGNSGNYQYHAAGITSHNADAINSGDLRFFVSNNASADSSTGVTEAMRVSYEGNVGIGTDSPGDALVVKGGSPGNIDLVSFQNNAGNETHRFYADSANDGVISTLTNSGVIANLIQSSGNSYLNGGNVGIGTTSPTAPLHIEGTANVPLLTLESSGDTILQINRNDNTIGGGNRTGIIQFGAEGSWGTNLATSKIWSYAEETFTSTANGTSLRFFTTELGATSPTEKMIIDTNGNVGIGTTTPDTLLNLEGVKNTSIITLGSTTNDSNWSVGDKYGGINFYSADASGAGVGVKASISYEVTVGTSGATNSMVFRTAGTTSGTNNVERMRIEAGGNVGIGTTGPSTKLEVVDTFSVQRTSTDNEGFYVTVSGADANAIVETFYQEDSNSLYGFSKKYDGSTNLYQEFIHDNSATGTEVYRVNRSTKNTSILNGNVGIGTTSPTYGKITVTESGSAYTGDYIYGGTNGSYGALRCTLSASNSPSFIDFFRSSYSTTVPVGAIVTSGSNCLYQSYSDYRMKENVSELTGALDKVNNIQPKTFNYKEDTETTYQGFIAHELQEVVPQAVSGKKDEVNEDGTPKYQGVDNSHIVPLLVGAIQELKAEIELLKTQINN